MTNNDELALKLKAKASMALDAWNKFISLPDDVDLERGLSLYEMSLLSAHDAASNPVNILAMQAERDADKKLIEIHREMFRNADADIAALRQRIAELEAVCAESYQVVGALADAAGVFETSDAISKVLDNLSAAKLVHEDVLPFAVEARTVSVKLLDCDYGAVQHMSGGSNDYCNGFVDGIQNAVKQFKAGLDAAGIKLEPGE